ncbi:anti-sigma factor [Demequina lutea]|uniref:Regulator of SigK n=1 Tax=Demequina lutea TaxID=431489 RepID=A0A7Y9ZAQ3_9MICO|nr:anti-sigma factor [Demequina lutea]NYI41907.1 anti-sigma-K factor RskA [Demequina lutea]
MNSNIDGEHSLLGPYVVGALDDEERVAFERHLASCEWCQDEARGLEDAAATLADAQAVTPPLSLRASVMSEVARTAQVPPELRSPASVPRRRRRWPVIVTAAASLIAVAGIGVAYGIRDTGTDVSALERNIVMLSTAPDAHSMELGLGSSHLVMSNHMDEVAVMGHDAPMPADGMEYQLWFVMADGTPVAGPTFMPDKSGDIMALSAADCSHIAAFSVTVEPQGGSPAPTGDVIASIDL